MTPAQYRQNDPDGDTFGAMLSEPEVGPVDWDEVFEASKPSFRRTVQLRRKANGWQVLLVKDGKPERENTFRDDQPNAEDRARERAETWASLYGCGQEQLT